MKKTAFILTAILILTSLADAQNFRLDNWQSHSSLRNGTACTTGDNSTLWFATHGGVFSYDYANEEIVPYRNIDALMSLNITAIDYQESTNRVFCGQENGSLDIYDVKADRWEHISDITRADNFPQKNINKILIYNETAYIGGGFGLAILNTSELVFTENVLRIGDFKIGTEVLDIELLGNEIWLCTPYGIAVSSTLNPLTLPTSWTCYSEGLPDSQILDMGYYNGHWYVATDHAIYILNDDEVFEEIKTFDSWVFVQNFTEILKDGNPILLYATNYDIYDIEGTKYEADEDVPLIGCGIVMVDNTQSMVFFKENNGFYIENNQGTEISIKPNTPNANGFMDINKAIDGGIWIAGDYFNLGFGESFMHFKNGEWTIYDETNPMINKTYFNKINQDETGRVFISCYGGGLYVGTPSADTFNFELYTNANSPLIGTVSGKWDMPGEVKFDDMGTAWIVSEGDGAPGPVLVSLDRNNVFHSYTNTDPNAQRKVYALEIDNYGTKWIGGRTGSGLCLQYYNEMGTSDDKSDDIFGTMTVGKNSNLLSNEHPAIANDKQQDMIWIGTNEGVTILPYPVFVLQNEEPDFAPITSVAGQNVNDIFIDAQNLKWIATKGSGVWVLSGTGDEVVAHIDMDNSPLTTNDVNTVIVDERNGDVFFGTKEGLFQAKSLSVKPAEKYDISCYPQPFKLQGVSDLMINGLASMSAIHIMTIDGITVRSLNANSKVAVWDGRDDNGNLVSPGIYIISAKSTDSEKSGVGKIAVVN